MRVGHGIAWWVAAAPLLLVGAKAFSDDVAINVTNDGTDDIMLTVFDTTVGPKAVVLSQRVNGFATIPVHLLQDPQGKANLSWSAVTVDPRNRRCGHASRSGLGDSAAVTVHVDSNCDDVSGGVGSISRGEVVP